MPENYRISRELWAAQLSAKAEREKRALDDATATVCLFKSHMVNRQAALFCPTIGTALLAQHPGLRIVCDVCETVNELDLRMKPRDPDASIRVVLKDVRCPRCNGHGRPRIIGLAKSAT